MKSLTTLRMVVFALLIFAFLSNATAQQPSPSPTTSPDEVVPVDAGEDAGSYTVISSIEFGYRGLQVVGDLNKYQSDLNYKAGPRLFDSSLFMRADDGKGMLFDTLMVTSTGWGADQTETCDSASRNPKCTGSTAPIVALSTSGP